MEPGEAVMGAQILPDPHGHEGPTSKIERVWAHLEVPGQITRRRELAFDSGAALTYAPVRYEISPFASDWPTMPDNDWIGTAFVSFVRGEFPGKSRSDAPVTWRPLVEGAVGLPTQFLTDVLRRSERTVYAGGVDIPRGLPSAEEMAGAIYEFLCHPSIGSRKNLENNNATELVARLAPQIRGRDRLIFVLPGFPFKDQNRFRVPYQASQPDLADVAFMIRLHLLTQAIYQVHPYGADVVVLSDGRLYADIFGVPKSDVDLYMARMKWYRNLLNLQGTVSFLDLKELIDGAPEGPDGRPVTHFVKGQIESQLRELVAGEPQVAESLSVLVRGIKWNRNTRTRLTELSDAECWSAVREPRPGVSGGPQERWDSLDASATQAAYDYASTNLMLRFLDLVERVFPGGIRATVHPKPKQFALAGAGGLYAWNGVAWADEEVGSIANIKVLPFYSLVDRGPLERVILEPDGYPLFFRRARRG